MPYQRINWKNGETGGTPLNETNLNKMDSQIAQNVADIDELKNKPGGAMLVLTNASPLPACDSKPILGIDAKGKSEQKTTQTLATVQGNMPTVEVGSAINQTLGTSTTRCVSNIVRLGNGSVLSVTSGFEMYVLYAESENGNIVTANGWLTSRTVTADGYYRIQIRKSDNSNITPTSFVLTATNTPTPSNPIPIVDASGDVVARTVNLTDKQNTGSNLALPKALPKGTYTLSFETDMANNSFRLSNSTDTSTNSVSSGVRVSLGGNRYAITLTTTFESNYYSTNASGGTYVRNIQIEEGTTATSYVPYQSNTITLPYTLRSVGTVADELIVNEDGTGKLIRKIGTVDLSTLTWNSASNYYHSSGIADKIRLSTSTSEMPNMLCTTLSANTRSATTGKGTDYITVYANGNIVATPTNTPIGFLYYELATPIETPLTAEEVASIRQLQTYKGTTIIESEMDVVSVTYSGDVKAYVDGFHTYSTVPTICGYEEDGTPIYRVKIYGTTPSAVNTEKVITNLITKNNAKVKNIGGMIETESFQITPNMYYSSTYNIATFVTTNGIVMRTPTASYTNMPCEIIVEYTLKDSAPAAASVLSLDETEE